MLQYVLSGSHVHVSTSTPPLPCKGIIGWCVKHCGINPQKVLLATAPQIGIANSQSNIYIKSRQDKFLPILGQNASNDINVTPGGRLTV